MPICKPPSSAVHEPVQQMWGENEEAPPSPTNRAPARNSHMGSDDMVTVTTGTTSSAARPKNKVDPAMLARKEEARKKATLDVARHILHGRCCIVGLMILQGIRTFAWMSNVLPVFTVVGMHCLSVTSDIGCVCCAIPLFTTTGTGGRCIQWACLGPMVTMVFAMVVVDSFGLLAYFIINPQRPIAPGYITVRERLEVLCGAWESFFLASVALQMALLCASWRVYRVMRLAGLYPPGNDLKVVKDVSVLEVMCEAEDVALLGDCECGGGSGKQHDSPRVTLHSDSRSNLI